MQSIGEVVHRSFFSPFLADNGADGDLPATQEGLCRIHHPLLAPSVRRLFPELLLVLTLRRQMGFRFGLELSLALACRLSKHGVYGKISKAGTFHSRLVDQRR